MSWCSLAGHRQDFDVLRALSSRTFRYVGLIGSRAKVARLTEALIDAGVPADWLKRLRAPIGFDIGAVSPEEIAVAILAELIAVRRGKIDEPHVAGLSLQWARAGAARSLMSLLIRNGTILTMSDAFEVIEGDVSIVTGGSRRIGRGRRRPARSRHRRLGRVRDARA
jgi:hypothetical protein